MMPVRILFVKESQSWPRASGHDVHGYGMMDALIARGHSVSLATVVAPSPLALEGLNLTSQHDLTTAPGGSTNPSLTRLQRKFADYYGVKSEWFAGLKFALHHQPVDAVVIVARHLLPLLAVVKRAARIWYPADDPAWHHLSRVKLRERRTWSELRPAVINGLYERSYRSCFDRVWVVSPADRTALRLLTGCRKVDLVSNGVDAEYFRPARVEQSATSCAFWGRLDFGPNEEALDWFLRRVWPTVVNRTPTANLSVFGFNPTERIRALAQSPGVSLHANLPDLREEVQKRQVVVLPFVTGGGIKNKLLEAAALGMPIVSTRWALSGAKGKPPVRVARDAEQWSTSLANLWSNPLTRAELGSAARRWVLTHHTWDAAARAAESALIQMQDARRSRP